MILGWFLSFIYLVTKALEVRFRSTQQQEPEVEAVPNVYGGSRRGVDTLRNGT